MKTKPTKFLLLMPIAFILNFIWEIVHYPLYYDLSGISKYPHILIASLTDMLIIFGIFLFLSLIHKNISWIKKPKIIDYIGIVFLSLIIAIFIEYYNLSIGRWAYTLSMPTIFGIGLSPLLQLAVTAILSLFIIKLVK